MEVRRIGETFFAEVDDVDVSKGFDAAEWQAFYDAYLEHQVLVLHGQTLSAGGLRLWPVWRGLSGALGSPSSTEARPVCPAA